MTLRSNLSTNTIINLDMLLRPEKQSRHFFDLTTMVVISIMVCSIHAKPKLNPQSS